MKNLMLFLLVSCLILPAGAFATEQAEVSNKNNNYTSDLMQNSKDRITEDDLVEFALTFINTTFSDFAETKKYRDDLISNDSLKLKEFVSDRRKVNNLKQDLSNRTLNLLNSDVIETKITNLDNNMYEVLVDINYTYMDGDLKSSLESGYKIILAPKNETFQVIAATSNDLSGGILNNKLIVQSTSDLDIDYQLSEFQQGKSRLATEIQRDYDIDAVESSLINYFDEIKNEKTVPTTEDNLNTRSIFVHFSSSQLAEMRKYQDNYYKWYNTNYASFDGIGGDCTNYASQILRAGGALMYTSASNGISGSDRWFYRSSMDRSSSWTGVNQLRSFLLNNSTRGPKGTISSTYGALTTGSVIQLGSSGDYYHTIIVYNQGGDPTVTAHSNSYSGYFSSRYGGTPNSKILISGYYQS